MKKIPLWIVGFFLLSGKPIYADVSFGANYQIQEGASPNIVNVVIYDLFNRGYPFNVIFKTTNGTATSTDYNPVVATRNWPMGLTSWTVPVTINDDLFVEGDETINLTVTTEDEFGNILHTSNATITIADNDVAPPNPTPGQIHAALMTSTSVIENTGNISFKFTREGGKDGPLSIRYETINGSAQAGFDFTQTSGIAIFADQDTTPVIINLPILNDSNVEPDEKFNLIFTWLDGALVGQTESHEFTVIDDDLPFTPTPDSTPDLPSKNLVDLSKQEKAEIRVTLPSANLIDITIYDRLGREMIHQTQDGQSGPNTVRWDGRDQSGSLVSEGIYRAIIKAGGRTQKLSIVILK